VLKDLALKYGKTPAQIVLRWDLQKGVITIPKSVRKERIIENSQIFDFQLTDEDMQRIDGLNQDLRLGPDPDRVNF
jgi:diketogulonate reductase-like aldo/keto reductase